MREPRIIQVRLNKYIEAIQLANRISDNMLRVEMRQVLLDLPYLYDEVLWEVVTYYCRKRYWKRG